MLERKQHTPTMNELTFRLALKLKTLQQSHARTHTHVLTHTHTYAHIKQGNTNDSHRDWQTDNIS